MSLTNHFVIATNRHADIAVPSGELSPATSKAFAGIEAFDISPERQELDPPRFRDPHCLRNASPAVFAAYRVAVDCYPKLLNRSLDKGAVIDRLRRIAPKSAFRFSYVNEIAFKLINPYGHGANSSRFDNDALAWFRRENPEDRVLTKGLTMLICAAKWWTHEQGNRSTIPHTPPLTTADLLMKLKAFGFLEGERSAACRMLRRVGQPP